MKSRNLAFQSELFDIPANTARTEYDRCLSNVGIVVPEVDLRYFLLLIYASDPDPLLRSVADHFRYHLNTSDEIDNRTPPVVDQLKAAN